MVSIAACRCGRRRRPTPSQATQRRNTTRGSGRSCSFEPDPLPTECAHRSVPSSTTQQEKMIGKACGPRMAAVSRHVGAPASAGRRAKIFGNATAISRRARLAPRPNLISPISNVLPRFLVYAWPTRYFVRWCCRRGLQLPGRIDSAHAMPSKARRGQVDLVRGRGRSRGRGLGLGCVRRCESIPGARQGLWDARLLPWI